jgi:hypothetical protein
MLPSPQLGKQHVTEFTNSSDGLTQCVENIRVRKSSVNRTLPPPHFSSVVLFGFIFAVIHATDAHLSFCFGFCISLILEWLLRIFQLQEKGETFFFNNSFIHFFEPRVLTRTCVKWALSPSPGILCGKTVICFTYFLVSFFFSHLVILPSFSRRKLKWKEKVEPMFYTNSSFDAPRFPRPHVLSTSI